MPKGRNTLMDPPVESLLDKVDSKFTLVALGSIRARQVNAYYNSLGQGIGRVVPPQVTSASGKPLSIAFEEIAAGKATYSHIDPEAEAAAQAQAAALMAEAALAAAELASVEESVGLELLDSEISEIDAELRSNSDWVDGSIDDLDFDGSIDIDGEDPAAS